MPVEQKARRAVKKTDAEIARAGRAVEHEAKKGDEALKKGARRLRKKV